MPLKRHEFTTHELAMRAVLLVEAYLKHSGSWILVDYADLLCRHFQISRAQAFRIARIAMDVLCIAPLDATVAAERRKERHVVDIRGGHVSASIGAAAASSLKTFRGHA